MWHILWKKIMNKSISTKLILFIYTSILILLLILSTILLFLAEDFSKNELDKTSFSKLDEGNLMIEQEQSYMYGISDYYCISHDIQEMIIKSNLGEKFIHIPNDMSNILKSRMYTVSLVFYNTNGEVIDYISIDNSHFPVPQSPNDFTRPFGRLINKQYGYEYEWEFIDKGDTYFMKRDNSPKLSLWRTIKSTLNLKPIGVLCISIDTGKLFSTDISFSEVYNKIILLEKSGRTVFNKTEQEFSSNANKSIISKSKGDAKGKFITKLDNKLYRVYYTRVKRTDITSFLLIPYKNFTWNMQIFSVYTIVGLLLITMLLFPFIAIITKMLTEPLKKLTNSIQQFSNGNYNIQVPFKYEDEIGKLYRVFNEMVKENQRLIEKTYILKLREQEAELNSLHEQINPHLLYNILNSIHWKATSSGNEEIADIAFNLAQFFRISLNSGRNIYELHREKDLVLYYLKLQKGRYGNRLNYEINFSDDVLNICVPKLLIQPLVENSIVHGIEKCTHSVKIKVSVHFDQFKENIIICVEDNGLEIPENILELLPDKLPPANSGKRNRFALKNISERIRLTYGKLGNITIKNCFEGGVVVLITLPFNDKITNERKIEDVKNINS